MHIHCPHCQNPIELVDDRQRAEVVCPSCGSTIMLDTDRTQTYLAARSERRLGKYELIESIGMGAFGTVHKARDTELDRTVALKIPRAGNFATQQDADRLLREARSAAQLKHPGIVALYDAVQTDGVCYLVSEFVDGITLADRLSAGRLGFRQAAELTAELADALSYAHERGVIHRDLKPSNIMLEMANGQRPRDDRNDSGTRHSAGSSHLSIGFRPKLLDFGLAKRDAGEITMTMEGQVLGTPAYMSPEQARGEAHRVDARSDIYSLGVILYELLTGELPFRGNSRMLLLQVLHDEPRAPRRINDRIPRDLETIALKAMDKVPGRRYPSASELAIDLRRWLNGEPIHARPASTAERAIKWARRRPATAGLAAALVLATATIIGVLAASNIRIAEERQQALDQRKAAEAERTEAQVQRDHARNNLRHAERFANETLNLEELVDIQAATQPLRTDLAESAIEFYLGLAHEQADDPETVHRAAMSLFRAANVYRRTERHEQSLETLLQAIAVLDRLPPEYAATHAVRDDRAAMHNSLANSYILLGRSADAETAFGQSLAAYEQLRQAEPNNPNYLRGLAAIHNNRAAACLAARQLDESLIANEQSLKLLENLVGQYPQTPKYQYELASSYFNLGKLYDNMNRPDSAVDAYRNAIAILDKLRISQPADSEYQIRLAETHSNLGDLYAATGRVEQSENELQQAESLWLRITQMQTGLPVAFRQAMTHAQIAGVLSNLKREHQEALPWYDRSIQTLEDVLAAQPSHSDASFVLSRALIGRANVHYHLNKFDSALSDWNRVLAMERNPQQRSRWQVFRAGTLARLGDHNQAAAEVSTLVNKGNLSDDDLFDVACVYSLAVSAVDQDSKLPEVDRHQRMQELCTRATAVLRKLHEQGFFNVPSHLQDLRQEKDLDVLRSRDDFRELLKETPAP